MALAGGDDWLILRTNGSRTLALAKSLESAGVEAWTPIGMVTRRDGRTRDRVKVPVPILPTFVFARYRHLAELQAARAAPVNPHPAFSIFRLREADAIPFVRDRDLRSIRTEERRQKPRAFPVGGSLTVPEGAFAGLTGIIEGTKGKYVLVLLRMFGRDMAVQIETCQVPDDAIHAPPSAMDPAARAA